MPEQSEAAHRAARERLSSLGLNELATLDPDATDRAIGLALAYANRRADSLAPGRHHRVGDFTGVTRQL